MRSQILQSLALLAVGAQAHFILNYPTSLGFDDDKEPTAPCGGFDVVFADNDTSVQVGGFAVALLSTHPSADWLYRATLSKTAPYNWTNLLPVVSETGLGHFCLPSLQAPDSYAGQQGLIQVIQDGPDGVLYQCAAVNFVSGSNTTVGSACTNATGLTASITDQSAFTSTAASASSSTAASSSSAAAGSTSASSAGAAAAFATPFVGAMMAGVGIMAFV